MPLLYDLGTGAYHVGVRLAAPFNPKAKAWVEGRRDLWKRMEAKADRLNGCLWMHCASVGEFEQGRPVLEAIKQARPDLPVLLTFFSPSGYEARKDFPLATHVDYLPPDGAANAARLVALVEPKAAVFVKYEFWYHHLHALKKAGVPTWLASAIFRSDQPFFRWYGAAWRSVLACFTRIFTQDEASRALLAGIGVVNVTVSGDTRFDRVADITRGQEELPVARIFRDASPDPLLVCGSTWPDDERLLLEAFAMLATKPRVMIAPHEATPAHLAAIEASFPKPLITWSEAEAAEGHVAMWASEHERMSAGTRARLPTWPHGQMATCLIDHMGLLARLYRYADITYVGGGFGDGIHSLLEAAAWGKPVIFGPHHGKFAEAKGLIDAGAGFEVKSAGDLRSVLEQLLRDPSRRELAGGAAARYVNAHVGATAVISKAILPVVQ